MAHWPPSLLLVVQENTRANKISVRVTGTLSFLNCMFSGGLVLISYDKADDWLLGGRSGICVIKLPSLAWSTFIFKKLWEVFLYFYSVSGYFQGQTEPKRPKTGFTEIIMAAELACQQNNICDNSEDFVLWWRFGKWLKSVEKVVSGTRKLLELSRYHVNVSMALGSIIKTMEALSKLTYTLSLFLAKLAAWLQDLSVSLSNTLKYLKN